MPKRGKPRQISYGSRLRGMANPKHVAKLKEGVEAWNAWRAKSNEIPDLSEVKLRVDRLDHYDLTHANFSGAHLVDVSFYFTQCEDCSFEQASLTGAFFDVAWLKRCNFRSSVIEYSVFNWCR